MGKARLIWNLLFFSADVYTIVRWIQPEGLTMGLQLGAPEYAALITMFTGGLAGINWIWIRAKWQAPRDKLEQLGSLGAQVYEISRTADKDGWDSIFVDWGVFDLKLWEMREGVSSIGVRFPLAEPMALPLSPEDMQRLQRWLRPFVASARARNLKAARKLPIGETNV